MTKTIHLGTSDFATIINNNGLLVDKSLFIKEIIDNISGVTLITRPRRFGKTLNMTMLHYFFARTANGIETNGLFNNLAISQLENGKYITEHQGKYSVIFISFKDIKASTFSDLFDKIVLLMRRLYAQHENLLTVIDDHEKKLFNKYLNCSINRAELEESLLFLSELLFKFYKQKVYILIDEYDTPLNCAYLCDCLNELTSLMRNLFSVALKDNPYLQQGIMTGITRISKDSMLSGLNNLKVYTLLEEKYSNYFGFTDIELDYLFKEQDLEYNKIAAKTWYNGYLFGNTTIYNPWSILSCLDKKGKFEAYWVHTSNNDIIKEVLLEFKPEVQSKIIELMQGKKIIAEIDSSVAFDELANHAASFWSLMLFGGYLTASAITQTTTSLNYACELSIPNLEVKLLLNHLYKEWFKSQINQNYTTFLNNLINGRVTEFNQQLNEYLLKTVSVRDTGINAEKFYHGLVLGLIASLAETHHLESNLESGYGYADLLITPLIKTKFNLGIVIEFKHATSNKNLSNLAHQALEQIETKHYELKLHQHPHIKQILKIGLAFNKKQVIVASTIEVL